MDETLLFKNSSRQPTGAKPVRSVWETGQASFAKAVGKNLARGKNLTFTSIDLLNRSTDLCETLGIAGVPHGLPLATSLVPKNLSNQEESEVNPQENLPKHTIENHQIEAVSEGLLEQDHQAKRHKVLICDIQQDSLKKCSQNFSTEIPRKGSENHQKGKMGRTQTSLEKPRRIIYTYHERYIQGLASARSSFPLTRSHHEALKLVLENPRKNRKGKITRQNELGFQEIVAILSPLGLYGGNRKTKLPLSPNTRIRALEGHFGNHCVRTIRRMPNDRKFA
jgi:hypothetical protein